MGAVLRQTDTELVLDFYRAGRALGFGERLGMFDEEHLRKVYLSIVEGLEGIEERESDWTYHKIAHVMAHLRVAEFEVAYTFLIQRFPSQILRGISKKEMYELFLRYHAQNPALKTMADEERNMFIDRLVETGLFRRDWFDRRQRAKIITKTLCPELS